jgi:AcrR family transcriptional regulator
LPTSPTARRPRTVAALLDGALAAFAERGYDGASIGYICQRAGLTTGAFYSNFGDKQELFFALAEAHTERTLTRLADLADSAVAHPERLDELLGDVPGPEPEDRLWSLLTLEFRLFAARHPEAAARLAEQEQRRLDRIADLLTRVLAAAGRTPARPPTDLARAFLAVHTGFALHRAPTGPWPDPLERDLLPRLLSALSTPHG